MKKRVLVLNGSPTKNGNTDLLIQSFMKGVTEAGHDVVKIDIDDYHIEPFKGFVQQNDDFSKILDELNKANVVVWASPLYWMTFSAQIKLVMDRMSFSSQDNFAGKETAMLITAASPKDIIEKNIVPYYQMCFIDSMKWIDRGMVLAGGNGMSGQIKESSDLELAYQLGASI